MEKWCVEVVGSVLKVLSKRIWGFFGFIEKEEVVGMVIKEIMVIWDVGFSMKELKWCLVLIFFVCWFLSWNRVILIIIYWGIEMVKMGCVRCV